MYLIYFHRGILKIKHGKMVIGSFVSDDDYRHTMIPKEPLTVEHGKIWCEDEINIPYAASILIDHREKYVKEMQEKWGKDFGFEGGFIKPDGAVVHKDEHCMIPQFIGSVEIKNDIERMKEMAAKKKTDYINDEPKSPVSEQQFTEAELRYLKEKIRNDIVMYESKKSDTWAGKRYGDMSACEKTRIDRNLQISYDIFDKLLMMGIREDV